MPEKQEEHRNAVEANVRKCYSTWGQSYYDEYYGAGAPYPPVHVDLVRGLLRGYGAKRVLDAGCGPASMMRHLFASGVDVQGFDLTPEMVAEARVVLAAAGVAADRVWEGSVLTESDYVSRADGRAEFDCTISCGVLPHIPVGSDEAVIHNLKESLRPGGYALIEARNELFALFTMNRYSHQFFLERLFPAELLRPEGEEERQSLDRALDEVKGMFRTDLPAIRRGKASEPGYDEVVSRTHNPLVVRSQLEAAGFVEVKLYFYHFHSLPPLAGALTPSLFRRSSLAMENDPENWRGLFMASAFFVAGRRP
jgi:2-polyprenyl-3-methyl-5-hydroxy-6-metoxy-1,4-benzoquinol methylase